MNISDIKNIIWDFNGTLLDDVAICLESINPLLASRNLPTIDKLKYQEVFTFPVMDYYQAIGFDFNKEPFEIPAMQFIDNYRINLPKSVLFDGIPELLTQLNKAGKHQVVLSAMEEPFLIKTLKQLNIAAHFEAIAGIQDHYANGKVDRGIKLLESLHFIPKETLLIGDTLHDQEVAEALGVQCLLISQGHYSHLRLCVNGNKVVKNVHELAESLLKDTNSE